MCLFLDFILNTLTFSSLNCSNTFSSTFDPSTTGVPTVNSLSSSSEINKAGVLIFDFSFASCFLTSIISQAFTVN